MKKHPGGFLSEAMQALGKKHRIAQMISFSQDAFKKTAFRRHQVVVEDMVWVVSRASMVSIFEKPKFRDVGHGLSPAEISQLSNGLKNLLHANQQKGFQQMVEILLPAKLAKWSLLMIITNYVHPDAEVFVKPTTAKGVIEHFKLQGLQYKPRPSWEFYEEYRQKILAMRSRVDDFIAPNNAAFCRFLMMSLPE